VRNARKSAPRSRRLAWACYRWTDGGAPICIRFSESAAD